MTDGLISLQKSEVFLHYSQKKTNIMVNKDYGYKEGQILVANVAG